MTKESDLRGGAPGKTLDPGGNSPERASPPSKIRMNMPDRGSTGPERSGAGEGGESQESIERLLLKLMGRLDDNDRHYGQALDNLNGRLNTLSQRAQSASTASPAGSAAALERVHEQASSLAAQVNDAGAARRAQQSSPIRDPEQRLGTFSNPLEGGIPPGAGAAVNDDFADVTQRLERSLEEGAPASGLDTLTSRMDDLARQMDSALASRSDPGTLRSIEARLEELARGFASAQQNYARIEGIESQLQSLMNWTQSANAPAADGNMYARLDAIERALQELNDNAREMDGHTGSTLAALNEAVESAPSRGGYPGEEVQIEIGETDPPQAASGEYADVWINEAQQLNANPEPARSRSRSRSARAPDNLGAGIPDYQPEPAASPEPHAPERRGGKSGRRAQLQDRLEPAYEEENDFIASARRAAAAAAAQAPEPEITGYRTPRAGPVPVEPAESAPSGRTRPRPFFVAAAIGLLLVSAGILFGQLRNQPAAEATGPVPLAAPQSSVPAPTTPADAADKRTSAPAPVTGGEKLHAQPMAPGQRAPGNAERAASGASPATAPATRASFPAPPPAGEPLPLLQPQQPLSTSTLLAALSQPAGRDLPPGVKVTITEPTEPSPATRARTAAPALVPPAAYGSRPGLLAPPKRAPAAPGDHAKAQTQPTDSAPAGRTSQPMPSRSAAMPPLRIGPLSLRTAAARGNPAAQVEVASRFAKGAGVAKNLKKAAEWYGRAAAQGFAPAQYRLAALHERGQGVKKDIAVARSWYRRAAELGNIRAMHNLAVLHTRAKPGSPDYIAAKNWFLEAASRGLADSQYNLGVLYESGLGVRKNAAEAYKWFTLAARQGDGEARKRREIIRPNLPARSLSAVEQTLKRWKPVKSAEAANRTGQPRGGWQNAKLPHAVNSAPPATVARAQKLLNQLGYDAGVPDGKLGPQTLAAIRRFEIRTGAAKSGRVTPELLKQLGALSS